MVEQRPSTSFSKFLYLTAMGGTPAAQPVALHGLAVCVCVGLHDACGHVWEWEYTLTLIIKIKIKGHSLLRACLQPALPVFLYSD